MDTTSKIVLPLDTDTLEKALEMARLLQSHIAAFKVGLELINAVGFDIFGRLRETAGPDVKIFYDCKLHDIPNTVAGAARAIARRNIWMLNVHAAGGKEMMYAAVQAAEEGAAMAGATKPLVIAVTVLTSIDAQILHDQLGVTSRALPDQVAALARLAQDSGCDGVVASPQETAQIRAACGPEFLIVTPGVRPAGEDLGDQKRVMTPGEAIRAGADYLVIGRPITGAADVAGAARRINAETAQALGTSPTP